MKVIISAEDDGKAILSTTLTFSDMEEGLRIASMLQAFARNQWQSSHDERIMKSLNQKQTIEPSHRAA
jgi:hypothetical protein